MTNPDFYVMITNAGMIAYRHFCKKEVYCMNHAEKARDLFRAGYNCAQSVVGAFHEEMGLSLEDAVRLASSFGGGMGGMRET